MKSSLFDLSGKTALVTGSSRGIGKAIATRLAQHGANVVVSGRRAETCAATVKEIEALRDPEWGSVWGQPANIGQQGDLSRLADAAVQRFGPIDILVCNAAINIHVGPTLGLGEAALRKVMEANIMSLYWLTRSVVPTMVERRSGRIIFISSTAGLTGGGASLSYGMTKAAGMNAMQTLAVELGPSGVRCNSIAPGMVETDMTRPMAAKPGLVDAYLARSPARAVGVPDDIAGVAVFLASRAGEHMNGQTLVVDGGYSIA